MSPEREGVEVIEDAKLGIISRLGITQNTHQFLLDFQREQIVHIAGT